MRKVALIAGALILAPWLAPAQQPAAPQTVHLDLTAEQLNVVLQGLGELKWKDVLPTYMAIVQQAVPAQPAAAGGPPASPPPTAAAPAQPLPAPAGDARLMQLAPGTKSDLVPNGK